MQQGLLGRALGVIVALMMAIGATGCGGSNASSGADVASQDGLTVRPLDGDDEASPNESSGQPLPDLSFVWWDGQPATTDDLIGQPTVINFFASTCPPCRTELPDFEAAAKEYEGKVRFVGIATNDDRKEAQALVDESGVTFELGEDPDNSMFVAMRGFAMPTTYFVDADGNIVYSHLGAMTKEMLDDVIRTSLGQEPTT